MIHYFRYCTIETTEHQHLLMELSDDNFEFLLEQDLFALPFIVQTDSSCDDKDEGGSLHRIESQ